MSKGKAHRTFATLPADFASIYPDKTGSIACPFCLREFQNSAIESGDLTEEHAISRHLGGTYVTLTCKSCNNTHGAELDSHLVQMVRIEDALEGEGQIRATVGIAATKLPRHISWRSSEKDDPRVIRILGGNSHTIERTKQAMMAGGQGKHHRRV